MEEEEYWELEGLSKNGKKMVVLRFNKKGELIRRAEYFVFKEPAPLKKRRRVKPPEGVQVVKCEKIVAKRGRVVPPPKEKPSEGTLHPV